MKNILSGETINGITGTLYTNNLLDNSYSYVIASVNFEHNNSKKVFKCNGSGDLMTVWEYGPFAIRPVVCLDSSVKLEKQGSNYIIVE